MGAISFSLDKELLESMRRALPLEIFVETGTFHGETLRVACGYFQECYSVELSPALYSALAEQFSGHRGVHLFQGESPDFLWREREYFAKKPTLFWLDAHWCSGEETAGQSSQSPLIQELEAIGSLHQQSVVLIDDARLYLSPPPAPHRALDWPDFHQVVQSLFRLSSAHRLLIFNDVIVFLPEGVKQAVLAHAREHGVDWLSLAADARKLRRRQQRWKRWRAWLNLPRIRR